ncbi:MAG: hypothetical protein ACKVOQ_14605 [Cyclobacteriaceae bacterium]
MFKWKAAGIHFRLFLFFLLIGLCTDVSMYYLRETGQSKYLPIVFTIYSLIESIVFYWMILENAKSKPLKLILKSLIFVTILFWILIHVLSFLALLEQKPGQLFDPFYEVAVAFMAGFTLLQMVESEDAISRMPNFWILLGIFFYCFCTFFIMGFLNTLLSQKIWFLNNIFNIISYLFYAIGFWKLNQPKAV